MNEQHEQWIDKIESDFKSRINPILDRLVDEIEILPPPPDPLRPSPSVEQLREEKRRELEEASFSRVEYRRLLRGRELILEGLDGTAHPHLCHTEMTAAFQKLAELENDVSELVDEVMDQLAETTADEAEPDEAEIDEFWNEFKSLREELEISEQTYEELYGIGLKHYQSRDVEAAASVFRFLTILDVTCYEAWFTFGLCLKELGEFDDAIQAFLTAVSTDGREPGAYLQLAHTYFLKGDESTAEAIVELGNTNMKALGVAPEVFAEWEQLSKNVAKSV